MFKSFLVCAAFIAATVAYIPTTAQKVMAQSIPTTAPSTAPTTAPSITMVPQTPPPPYLVYPTAPPPIPEPTTTAATRPITVTAYATTGPNGQPTTIPGTPPPTTPVVAGCSVFPAGDPVYNANIYATPVDPNSAAYINSYLAVAGANATLSYSGNLNDWFLNVAQSTDPRYTLEQTGATTPLNGITAFPFLSTYEWQGKHQVYTGDRHIMVLDPTNCKYYEGYTSTSATPPSWQVVNGVVRQPSYYGGIWDLTQPYSLTAIHKGGVNAGDVPQFAGMITPYDLVSGCICHALNMDVMGHALLYMHSVFPAHGGESLTYNGPAADATLALPMGAHLRIKASANYICPTSASASDCAFFREVVQSGKTYGYYIMDTGSYPGVLYLLNQLNSDGTFSFPYTTNELSLIPLIHFSDLEVVPPPGCVSVAACVK